VKAAVELCQVNPTHLNYYISSLYQDVYKGSRFVADFFDICDYYLFTNQDLCLIAPLDQIPVNALWYMDLELDLLRNSQDAPLIKYIDL
jgi:hypothetical protein